MWHGQISKPNLLALRAIHKAPKQNESVSDIHFCEKCYCQYDRKQEALGYISYVGEKKKVIMKINYILFKYFII